MSAKRSSRRARARRKLRVLVLMHEDLVPPDDVDQLPESQFHEIKTETYVLKALAELGHEVKKLGVHDSVGPIRTAVERWKPHIVFNLLEEFHGEALFDQHVVGFLELLRVPYTGSNPRGLVLARDKALSKKIATYHRIRTPGFAVCRRGRRPRRPASLPYPIIVKSLVEEASLGISQASVVEDDAALARQIAFIHEEISTDAILEQFIPGRELYAAVLGNERLTALPPRELVMRKMQPGEQLIATELAKHDVEYQVDRDVGIVAPRLSDALRAQLERTSKRIYRALELEGYGRIDYRLSENGELYFLEANPNPDIARGEEFASAAQRAGISYPELIQRILALGLRR